MISVFDPSMLSTIRRLSHFALLTIAFPPQPFCGHSIPSLFAPSSFMIQSFSAVLRLVSIEDAMAGWQLRGYAA